MNSLQSLGESSSFHKILSLTEAENKIERGWKRLLRLLLRKAVSEREYLRSFSERRAYQD